VTASLPLGLIGPLGDPEPRVRMSAANALVECVRTPPNPLVPFGPAAKGAAPAPAKLLDDPGAGVRTSVEAALR